MPEPMPEPLLSIPEVIRLTQMSESSVWREVREGRLIVLRFGRRVMVDPADYRAWLDASRTPTREDSVDA